jgi:hypothetical protein
LVTGDFSFGGRIAERLAKEFAHAHGEMSFLKRQRI